MGNIIELCPQDAPRRVHLRRRYLSEPRSLWSDHQYYRLALPSEQEEARAFRQAARLETPQWAGSEERLSVAAPLCDGRRLALLLQLRAMEQLTQSECRRVILSGYSPRETAAAFALLASAGVEVILYDREPHVAEALARHLYHRSGLAVQTMLTMKTLENGVLLRRSDPPPALFFGGKPLAVAVAEAAMCHDCLRLDCDENTIHGRLQQINDYQNENHLIFA